MMNVVSFRFRRAAMSTESMKATHCSCENPRPHHHRSEEQTRGHFDLQSRVLYKKVKNNLNIARFPEAMFDAKSRQCAKELSHARVYKERHNFSSHNANRGRPPENLWKAHRSGAIMGIGLNPGLGDWNWKA